MATVYDYFEQAQLSSAAYADLQPGMRDDAYKAALLASERISSVQADQFISKYTVVDQYTDPASGFSGSVFRDVATGQVYMAMRGTEPSTPLDWATNIADIGSDGIAIDQGIAMYNWYQRLITPVGGTATQEN